MLNSQDESFESMDYKEIKTSTSTVYVVQEIAGTREGRPKFNIMGASRYGELVTLLPENSQIIMSPGPLIFKLRKLLKNFTEDDYLLLTGDPAIIGVACSIVSDINNGKFNTKTKPDEFFEKLYGYAGELIINNIDHDGLMNGVDEKYIESKDLLKKLDLLDISISNNSLNESLSILKILVPEWETSKTNI